jgi:ABC-type transport system involved in cytochrome bd biosynthesis fused ATPase/permease subunit
VHNASTLESTENETAHEIYHQFLINMNSIPFNQYDVIVSLTWISVVLFGVVVMLHLFAVLYFFTPLVCLILMVEFYNIFADSKKTIPFIPIYKETSLI